MPRLQRAPGPRERHRGKRARGELPPGELTPASGKVQGQVLKGRVVPDQQDRVDLVTHVPQTVQELVRRGAVELGLDLNLAGGRDQVKCLARPERGRAEHQRDRDLLAPQVSADPLRRFAPAWRQRAIVIGEPRVVPARLRMAQYQQTLGPRHR